MDKNDNGLFNLENDAVKLNLFTEGADGIGVAETPSGKPYDAASVSIPKSEEISAEAYNAALTALKKSFKEGVDVLEVLSKAKIITESAEDKQTAYTEQVMYEAMVASYEDGPLFEAVQKEDKDEIKAIVKVVKKKFCSFSRRIKNIYKPISAGVRVTCIDMLLFTKLNKNIQMYGWQGICVLSPTRHSTIGEILKGLNEEFASELGNKYEFKLIKMNSTLGALGKSEEITDEDKAKKRKLFKMYLMIINEKTEKTPEMIDVKISKTDMMNLLKAQETAENSK